MSGCSSPMESKPHDTPSEVVAERSEVLVDGLDGISYSSTPTQPRKRRTDC